MGCTKDSVGMCVSTSRPTPARRGVSLAMDLSAVLIQASRLVDQHVSPLDGLDEPGNRPRVAAVRESCAV